MIIGVPREIKEFEYRVGVVPAGVRVLTEYGHKVVIQKGAGEGCRITDEEFVAAGAELIEGSAEIYVQAEMIMKVKEPLAEEYDLMREDQILYCYLHLAPAPRLTEILLERKVVAVAYETIQLDDGSLPLLIPMSEVAGRMAIQVGAHFLEKTQGGRGVLLGGVPGVSRGRVTILGAGTVGRAAAKIAVGMEAEVHIIDIDQRRLVYMDDLFGNRITTLMSNYDNISYSVADSHLVIGSVLIPGARAPRLVTRDLVKSMEAGAVIVDVAIDQGGCFETSRPTTHTHPTYVTDDVIHYCVPNMPGAVARTSTYALTNVTLPYALKLANQGLQKAVSEDPYLAQGVNIYKGYVTHPKVAQALGYQHSNLSEVLGH
jgi:alanine dehydrogenase